VSSLARFPILFATLTILATIPLRAVPLRAADGAAVAMPQAAPSSIVVGFVGGFVRHDNPHHGPVLLAERLRHEAPKGTYVRIFENRHRKTAYKTILQLLDRDHDGTLSDEEKAQARIILFGHSWGASAAVLLARELRRVGIPVLLTVQVDSVAKLWQHDGVIPQNVAAAVNFYQPHGLVHGRHEIVAADPSKTQILGNYRFDYKQEPVKCEGWSWYDRLVTPSHAESECDPHLWTQVENLVRQRLQPEAGIVAVNPSP
jgi:pimeloyl-ACP methyl ester carboxylesterase